jgi:hypothetical protein
MCDGDRCDAVDDREQLLQELDGFADPISAVLRNAVRDDGTLPGDYQSILDGLRAELDCAQDQQHSFVVLSNESFNPKAVFTNCTSDPQKASRAFVLLPSLSPDRDVEPGLVHMAGWDDEAGRYRRYATFPADDGGMHINIEPGFCLDCHGGPRELSSWQPLMNEMTNPWSQWNAEPGFASHAFDEYLADDVSAAVVFGDVTRADLLDSASNLEPVIRAGIDRFTGARLRARERAADIDKALALLQPAFCDETINFASEIHRTGEVRSAAVVDDAFRTLLPRAGAAGSWSFLSDTTMRLPEPDQDQANLTLFAVRGESTVQAELALVSRGVLSATDLLRVRALDYSRPVLSQFRCDLFDAGAERIRAGALDEAIAALGDDASNADLVPLLLAELLAIESNEGPLDLMSRGEIYSIADADHPEAASWLTADQLGDALQQTIDAANRTDLDKTRRALACEVKNLLPFAPLVPDVDC